jgi:hypothetical protein
MQRTTKYEAGHPPVSTLTVIQRAKLVRDLGTNILTMKFRYLHEWMEELVGRPVYTHELGDIEALAREIETQTPASLTDVINKLPPDKSIILFSL